MSKDIKYKIQFHTDWHCGSGLSAGADVDALVVKDKDGIPFIPGKTIKGLVREAILEMRGFSSDKEAINGIIQMDIKADDLLIKSLGYFDNKEDKQRGETFFSNAELSKEEREAITINNAARFMYRQISSTAIDESGIAKEHSLRKMEVGVPCELQGEILGIPDNFDGEIKNALKYIKRLGQNRNRGLGRCTFTEITITEGGK